MLQRSTKKTSKTPLLKKPHIKRGDTVMVISGKDKGKTGTVKRVLTDRAKVLVEGLNIMKKSVKPNPMAGQKGGIVEMEAPLHISKVMVYDVKASKPTRVKRQQIEDGGKKRWVRVSKVSGEQLDD